MKRLIIITGLALILTGCTGHLRVGYILEAGMSAEKTEDLKTEA